MGCSSSVTAAIWVCTMGSCPSRIEFSRMDPLLHGLLFKLLHEELLRAAPMGGRGVDLLLHEPFLGCREFLLPAWSNSSPPAALTSLHAGPFLSHFPNPVSLTTVIILPFLRSVNREAPPVWLMGSAVFSAGSLLEPSCSPIWGLLLASSHFVLPKPFYLNAIQQVSLIAEYQIP